MIGSGLLASSRLLFVYLFVYHLSFREELRCLVLKFELSLIRAIV
jgi:hypothetical protein